MQLIRLIVSNFFFLFLFSQCANKNIANGSADPIEPLGYNSDYFVFIADDGSSPLVVPIDINWTPHTKGYEVEYKSWYGTDQDWPIAYFKKNVASSIQDIPKEAYEHSDMEAFHFDEGNRSLLVKITRSPTIEISIPPKEEWSLGIEGSDFPTYAFRTSLRVGDKNRAGWMLYERIRFNESREFKGFEAFYWMPLVVNGNLYHFTQHRGKQTAVRWIKEIDNIKIETVPNFTFKIIETVLDAKSKRKEIPKTIQLQVPAWDLDITLKSTGEQVGYGGEYSKGLAYFRQSLLQSVDSGYGMMELILANN